MRPRVYVFGAVPETWEQRLQAACLWAGPAAYASHRSAARLWGMEGMLDDVLELTITRDLRADGVRLHRVPEIPARAVTSRDGIPITTATRTLADLGAVVGRQRLEAAVDWSLREGLTSLRVLSEALNASAGQGRAGVQTFRAVVEERIGSGLSQSELERRFRRVVRRYDLPAPVLQHPVPEAGPPTPRLDAAYPLLQLGIELDGYADHSARSRFQSDRARRNRLVLAGWTILNFTWQDMLFHEEVVVSTIRRALVSAGYRSP